VGVRKDSPKAGAQTKKNAFPAMAGAMFAGKEVFLVNDLPL
jgi:hypothetical protein